MHQMYYMTENKKLSIDANLLFKNLASTFELSSSSSATHKFGGGSFHDKFGGIRSCPDCRLWEIINF